jgi:hypothetical protein
MPATFAEERKTTKSFLREMWAGFQQLALTSHSYLPLKQVEDGCGVYNTFRLFPAILPTWSAGKSDPGI